MADNDDGTIDPPVRAAPNPIGRDGDLRGLTLGDYKVLSRLGEGGFGEVYLAEQTAPVKRRVALKVIKPGMDSRSVLARFEAERQAMALMDHPSVAKVYDAGLTPQGRPFFAMEYVRGQPITRFCETERLPVAERVELMMRVCAAVQHAHMKGVLHRDLKPSNILVETVDRKPHPRIIDFGVAKALHHPLGESTVYTELGQMVGTPEYMAPEQARGSIDVDTRADVYALGAILYELFTGVTPVESADLRRAGFAGMQQALEDIVPAAPSARLSGFMKAGLPSSHRAFDSPTLIRRVRGDLDWIVMKCLEKERARRYNSAAALAEDLERYLHDEPVVAGPPSAAYRAAKFMRRHRVGVVTSMVVLAAMIAAVVGTGYGLAVAVRERKRAEDQAIAADRARGESEAVTQFLTTMIESVRPDEVSRDVTVREVLDRAASRIAQDFKDRPLLEARLRHALGVSYWQLGRLDEAEQHLPQAVEIRRRDLGPDHGDTLAALANLAGLRLEQGRYREAGEMLQTVVDGYTRSVGLDHSFTLSALSNLAVLRSRDGVNDDVINLYQKVLDGQRRVSGPDHAYSLGAMVNLADAYLEVGRYDDAEPLLREAVDRFERVHGPDKPGTLLALQNLAMLSLAQGRLVEAESLLRRVIQARERVLGSEHADTLSSFANLGLILQQMGRLEEAEAAFTTSWNGLCKSVGAAHHTTLVVANHLVGLIDAQGWPDRSQTTVESMIEAGHKAVERTEVTADELNNHAWLLLHAKPEDLRDYATALSLARRACEAERTRKGPSLWVYLDTLASAQFQQGQRAEAIATQREAISLISSTGEQYRREMEDRLREYERAAVHR